jgi:hypothetical protein
MVLLTYAELGVLGVGTRGSTKTLNCYNRCSAAAIMMGVFQVKESTMHEFGSCARSTVPLIDILASLTCATNLYLPCFSRCCDCHTLGKHFTIPDNDALGPRIEADTSEIDETTPA